MIINNLPSGTRGLYSSLFHDIMIYKKLGQFYKKLSSWHIFIKNSDLTSLVSDPKDHYYTGESIFPYIGRILPIK